MIDSGEVTSRAELARTLVVSRARVTQMLQLLTLSPAVIDAIVQLGDPLSQPLISERSLRQVVGVSRQQQTKLLSRLLMINNKA